MGGILHVCIGNLCRSPVAERFMIAGLWKTYGPAAESVLVSSAGTQARPHQPMHPLAAAELDRRGIPTQDFSSTLLDVRHAEHAHVILTATREIRDEIAAAAPSTMRRVFTWREMAWLLDGVRPEELPGRYPAERAFILPRFVARRRGYLTPPAAHLLDVADPITGTEEDHRRAVAEIEQAIHTIMSVL